MPDTFPSGVALGVIGDVRYSVARTSQPWELEIDTIVVSLGSSLGLLGRALEARFREADWASLRYDDIRADKPRVLDLSGESKSTATHLERAVLVTPRDQVGDFGDITDNSLRLAVRGAVEAAAANGSRALGLPLLGTGALSEPADRIAGVLVPAAIDALREAGNGRPNSLVFVCQTAAHEIVITREFERYSRERGMGLAGGMARDLVDPTEGLPLSSDQLGFAPYVSMLATVMADRTTPLPLSIGIFGEWGSGKSTFMAMLRDRVRSLAGSDPRYCDQIAHIGFNAWHYADTNLWASLGDEIFQQLAGPAVDPKEHAKQIRAELAERLDQRDQLEFVTEQAGATAARLQAAVDRAIAERKTTARDFMTALRASPVFGSRIDDLWDQLGVSDQVEQAQLFTAHLHGTLTEADGLRRGVYARWGIRSLMVAAALLLAGVVGAMVAPVVLGWVGPVLGSATVFGGVGVWLLARTREGLRNLRAVTEDVQSQLSRATRDSAVKELAGKLAELRTAEAEQRLAQAQLDDVVAHVGELGRQLARLAPGRRLYAFLADRAQDESYSGSLGLVSTIRKDLAQLVQLMEDWRAHPEEWAGSGRPPDRIVLYIDDLDRCRPEQVVAVLQAVHLLLAFKLFVVVVGVDPRWLLRSLRSQYAELLHDGVVGEPDGEWHTPEDYLEKILNIPLVLPTMSGGSLGRLLRSIDREAPARAEPVVTQPDVRTARNEPVSEGNTSLVIEPGSEIYTQRQTTTEPDSSIPLTEPELELLAALDLLIETPREAKRLFNLYRMVRATRDLCDSSRFLGSTERPGEYQAVVILLGLLTAHARLLGGVLDTRPDPDREVEGGMAHRPAHQPWAEFVADLEPQRRGTTWFNRVAGSFPESYVPHWIRLHRGLAKLSGHVTMPDLSILQTWLPRIRCFSYVLMTTEVAMPMSLEPDRIAP
ncbi:O-acetyl-ADP-ribose deacetylase (regulator of RNase III) [Nocardia tenerifensis]|uniref:O-acetyl-ADP-ribose deacetylase (Regulator of RNase III) n=1 Tax=Nocardia tenerifensis TaxID=228006 RepID=A0A318K0Y2_9NOCA|nr:P-loop NTPase fold protein [Nocardia tenerifensis]PXX60455.1 O-acetyl-ADP-ribose deacetylase (regulator of RNase III) [Nocardia tenerifensis]